MSIQWCCASCGQWNPHQTDRCVRCGKALDVSLKEYRPQADSKWRVLAVVLFVGIGACELWVCH